VNDFEKMQHLYEEGVGGAPYPMGGQLRGFNTDNIGPNMKYSKGLKHNASPISYGKGEIPTVSPGATGKMIGPEMKKLKLEKRIFLILMYYLK